MTFDFDKSYCTEYFYINVFRHSGTYDTRVYIDLAPFAVLCTVSVLGFTLVIDVGARF